MSISEFKQSQSHGLFWDNEIRTNVFKLEKCINDTCKHDIPCDKNCFNCCENVSIKVSGNNNIDCGDILRFYDIDKIKITTIILLRYKQVNDTKELFEIIEINYNEALHNILFGTIEKSQIEDYVNYVKSIPKGRVSEDIKKSYLAHKEELQKNNNMRINISPKVDSKSQRRVQCSIPKINELLDQHPEFIISRTNEPIIRGVTISQVIKSTRRLRY